MPGGSNSGRPFREDPTSYSRTGIPCGNPKRYASRGVIRTTRDDDAPYKDQRLEIPIEDIETEGDRQLKALVKKQLNTQVSLNEQLGQRKEFTKSMVQVPLKVAGALSLSDYQKLEQEAGQLDELRQLGLTDEEILLKLATKTEEGAKPSKRAKYGSDPSILQDKLSLIDQKIASKKEQLSKPDLFSGAKQMSRHEMDLEKSITHDHERAKVMGILLSKSTNDAGDPNDPINNLEAIWEEVIKAKRKKTSPEVKRICDSCGKIISNISAPVEESIGCIKCKRRQILQCDIEGPLTKEQMSLMYSDLDVRKNLKDTAAVQPEEQVENENLKLHSDETVNSGPRNLNTEVELIPEDVIVRYRLSLEKIRELPRFKDYSAGETSKTLFLKNLSSRVEEKDLVALFHRFQSKNGKPIIYKLMSGRMKGQAFVSFESGEVATEALNLVNGYDFKGKPIIIQFGKNKT